MVVAQDEALAAPGHITHDLCHYGHEPFVLVGTRWRTGDVLPVPVGEQRGLGQQAVQVVIGNAAVACRDRAVMQGGQHIDGERIEGGFIGTACQQTGIGPVAEILDQGKAVLDVACHDLRCRKTVIEQVAVNPQIGGKVFRSRRRIHQQHRHVRATHPVIAAE